LQKKTYPDATEESYTYDAKGSILTAANRNISYTFTYDAAGKVKSVADSTSKVISYEYDALGNKTKMVSPEGKSLSYTYDTANRLTAILNGGTFTFGYDSFGRRTKLSYPNGDTTTYSYDKQGRLTNLVHKNAAGAVIASNSYSLDKIGNRLGNTTQDRIITYQYDAIYRLTQALTNTPGNSSNTKITKGTTTATEQQKEFYIYDPVGNRLTSDKTKSYTYNQANQLVTNGGTYSYDKNGNLIQKVTPDGTTTYSWDYENRLVKVVTATTTAEYAYDPFGKRIEAKVTENGATTTTRYFYDNQAILFEYDEKGNIGNRYIHGLRIDEPLMLTASKDKYYYHADGLGSIIALTDTAGKAVQTYEYDSFGNLKDQKNRVKQPFIYTGREWDKETRLYYYRARYYDPMEGRFISKDPLSFAGGDVNLYGYVSSNPISYIDLFGLDATSFLGDGRTIYDGPKNGNWGGKNWSGGRNPQQNWGLDGPQPPTDSADICYMNHDHCYGFVDNQSCGNHNEEKKTCDVELLNCLAKLSHDPRDWPLPPRPGTENMSEAFRTDATVYFGLRTIK
jgi:RHS repeat-associated protein